MRRHPDGSSIGVPARPNAFSPEFLQHLEEAPEPLTAGEADLSGPWKVEEMAGTPSRFAVLREWESVERGDVPEAVFVDRETAALCAAVLCLVGREPLFQLREAAEPDGFPVAAVFGDQGTRICGWLRQYKLQVVASLHLAEGLARTPRSLAEVARAAGGGALAQVGRYLAERQQD